MENISRTCHTKEFFINKAIGWALREYAKQDPEKVIEITNTYPISSEQERSVEAYCEGQGWGKMKKVILLMIFWCLIIFSVIAQISDSFIYLLSPNALSLIDERMTYTFVPVLINFFIVFLLRKIKVSKSLLRISFIINLIFFIFYLYYQFGDMGMGIFR